MSIEYGVKWHEFIVALKLVRLCPSQNTTDNLNKLLTEDLIDTLILVDGEIDLLINVSRATRIWVDHGRWEDLSRIQKTLTALKLYQALHKEQHGSTAK